MSENNNELRSYVCPFCDQNMTECTCWDNMELEDPIIYLEEDLI